MTVEFYIGDTNLPNDRQRPTQKQHFVPQLYLKAWCNSESGRFAVGKDGKVKDERTPGQHAYLPFFYQFIDLTPDELACLYENISRSFPGEYDLIRFLFVRIYLNILGFRCDARESYSQYVEIFRTIEARWRLTYAENVWKHKLLDHISGKRLLTDKEVQRIKNKRQMGFERFESQIEEHAKNLLRSARIGDISFMKDSKNAFRFLHYVFNQATRGPDYIRHLEETLPGLKLPKGTTSNVGKYIRYFLPLCLSHLSILKSPTLPKNRLVQIRNISGHDFITGDVPFIPIGKEQGVIDRSFQYIPISPKCALFYGTREIINDFRHAVGMPDDLVDPEIAKLLNKAICNYCIDTVFGTSKHFLEENGYVPPRRQTS